jgi:hypothetical protein
MASADEQIVDLEEIRRLNQRALRRVRLFVAKFLELEAQERELQENTGAESFASGKNDRSLEG